MPEHGIQHSNVGASQAQLSGANQITSGAMALHPLLLFSDCGVFHSHDRLPQLAICTSDWLVWGGSLRTCIPSKLIPLPSVQKLHLRSHFSLTQRNQQTRLLHLAKLSGWVRERRVARDFWKHIVKSRVDLPQMEFLSDLF